MITLIVAADKNWLIGKNNKLPWKSKEDLQHFKRTTMGCPIVMGRRTFESLPNLLPGREHFVVTSNSYKNIKISESDLNKVHLCSSLMKAINWALACAEPKKNKVTIGEEVIDIYEDEIFIIGGATLYHDVMEKDLVDQVFLF
jgi:dihydrofolate reductase